MFKMMISPAMFFSFFQNSDFSEVSKFINKRQKEILRCAPLDQNTGIGPNGSFSFTEH